MSAAQTTSPTPTSSPNDAETVVSSHQSGATKVGHAPAPPQTPVPSLHELEDVLYDILAAGDLNVSSDKLELIQAFLHEHARQRKTHPQFVSFFEEHGLHMRIERPNLFALPLVDSAARSARTPPLLTENELTDAEASANAAASIVVERHPRFAWVWAALGFAAIAGSLALGASAVMVMRGELARMNAAVAHSTLEIEQLRAETERLRAIVQTNSVAAQHTERDTQLLLQTLATPIAQNSR